MDTRDVFGGAFYVYRWCIKLQLYNNIITAMQ